MKNQEKKVIRAHGGCGCGIGVKREENRQLSSCLIVGLFDETLLE